VKTGLTVLSLLLVGTMGCSSVPEDEPAGPIARRGTAPTIDGVFDDAEWDDATVVRAGERELFRLKHDGTNLYLAVRASGGDVWLDTDAGLRVLHWSAQLGALEYAKTGAPQQTLDRPFAYELWGLQDEPADVIQDALADYLARNGWASNLASMGELSQSEMAISFDWLGVEDASDRYVELPGLRIEAGLLLSRGDPRVEAIRALSREEIERRYPAVRWPAERASSDSLGGGRWPEALRVEPADFGRIWIDLAGR
jgi:hypothetical protein